MLCAESAGFMLDGVADEVLRLPEDEPIAYVSNFIGENNQGGWYGISQVYVRNQKLRGC